MQAILNLFVKSCFWRKNKENICYTSYTSNVKKQHKKVNGLANIGDAFLLFRGTCVSNVEWNEAWGFFPSIILLWSYHSHHTHSHLSSGPQWSKWMRQCFFSAGLMDLVPLGSSANERLTNSQHTWPASMQALDFDLYRRRLFSPLFYPLRDLRMFLMVPKTKAVWLGGK